MYDPPQVTLSPGVVYSFAEGDLTGTGQKFLSSGYFQKLIITSP